MALHTQILLPLICGAIAEGYHTSHKNNDIFWPKESFDYDQHQRPVPLSSWESDSDLETYSPSSRDKDFYTYNSHGTFNSFGQHFDHQNGHNVPSVAWNWPKPPNNFSPYPFKPGSQNNERPVQSENIAENPNIPISTGENYPKSPEEHKKIDEISPTTHEEKKENTTIKDSEIKVELSDKKDNALVDNNGNNIYVLQPNNPGSAVLSSNGQTYVPITANSHKIELPSNAGNGQPSGNSIYVTIVANIPSNTSPVSTSSAQSSSNNQAPPINQNQGIVSGQPTNIPLSANKLDPTNAENAMMNNILNNPPLNNYTPIMIYANGQLILIPGFIINSQQNNPSKPSVIENQGLNIPGGTIYTNTQNQGYNPNLFQAPATGTPISNDNLKPQLEIQNFPHAQNTNSNDKLVYYGAPNGNNQHQATNVNTPNNYPAANVFHVPATSVPITTDGSNHQLGNNNFQHVPNPNSNNNLGYYNGPQGNNQNQVANANPPNNGPPPNFYQVPATAAPIVNDDSKSRVQNYQQVPSSNNNNNLGYYNTPHGNDYYQNANGNYPNDQPNGNPVRPPPSWSGDNNVNVYQQPSATKDKVEEEEEKSLTEETTE